MNLRIDLERIAAELEQLATFSDAPAPAVTRIVLHGPTSKPDVIKDMSNAAHLDIREDAVGDLFARWVGSDANAPAVATGSRRDAIPHSGRYERHRWRNCGLGGDTRITGRRISTAQIDRVADIHIGRTDAIWDRLPWKPATCPDYWTPHLDAALSTKRELH